MRILSVLSFVFVFIPWFIYNKIHYGNIFASLADSYALNILYREYVVHTVNISFILLAANILLPLIIIGIWYFFIKKDFSREHIILGSAMLFIFYAIYSMKADIARYYIPLTIPFVFFSVYGFQGLSLRLQKTFIVLFLIFTCFFTIYSFSHYGQKDFSILLSDIEKYDNCALQSNIWVPLSYQGRLSEAFPAESMVNYSIEEGYIVLFYYDAREPAYMSNSGLLHSYPVLLETEEYILLGEGCKEVEAVDSLYIKSLNERLSLIYNYTVSEDPCEILFGKTEACPFVNKIFTVA